MESSRFKVKSWFMCMALGMLSMFAATSAHAVDGCKLLLCLAGNWRNIGECRPTVFEAFRDMARGRAFPTCSMSGAGNSANNTWVDQASCPMMYRQFDPEYGAYIGCSYPGRISVYINGNLWSQTFWHISGNSSTWYSDAARTNLTQHPGSLPLDDLFLSDLLSWNTVQTSRCNEGGGTVEFDQFGAVQTCSWPFWGGGG